MNAENQVLELEELTIKVTHEADVAHIAWQGVSEIQDAELSVGTFLKGLLPGLPGKKVVMDFRQLEYMNSASLLPFLQILKELNSRNIFSTILYSPAVEWQRISFRSIKVIAATLPHISVIDV